MGAIMICESGTADCYVEKAGSLSLPFRTLLMRLFRGFSVLLLSLPCFFLGVGSLRKSRLRGLI